MGFDVLWTEEPNWAEAIVRAYVRDAADSLTEGCDLEASAPDTVTARETDNPRPSRSAEGANTGVRRVIAGVMGVCPRLRARTRARHVNDLDMHARTRADGSAR